MIENELIPPRGPGTEAWTNAPWKPHVPASSGDDGGPSEPHHHRRRRRRGRGRLIAETLVGLCIALTIALLARAFIFQVFYVPSSSMVPTLQIGDRILVDKFLFSWHSVHAGDIVVFRTPQSARTACNTDDGDLVKRVVATGGETIRSVGNTIYVDGKPLSQSYLPPGTSLGRPIPLRRVPANDFFVLGDNRSISCDSRWWGPLPGKDIVGRVVAVIWRSWHPDLLIF